MPSHVLQKDWAGVTHLDGAIRRSIKRRCPSSSRRQQLPDFHRLVHTNVRHAIRPPSASVPLTRITSACVSHLRPAQPPLTFVPFGPVSISRRLRLSGISQTLQLTAASVITALPIDINRPATASRLETAPLLSHSSAYLSPPVASSRTATTTSLPSMDRLLAPHTQEAIAYHHLTYVDVFHVL